MSSLTKTLVTHHYGIDPAKVEVVYNAIETNGSYDEERYKIHFLINPEHHWQQVSIHALSCFSMDAITALRAWQREQQSRPEEPVFPSTRGGPLGRDGVAYLLTKHVAAAQQRCPSLQSKRVTLHVLRHSAAMALLQSGVDSAVIAVARACTLSTGWRESSRA